MGQAPGEILSNVRDFRGDIQQWARHLGRHSVAGETPGRHSAGRDTPGGHSAGRESPGRHSAVGKSPRETISNGGDSRGNTQ